MRSISPLLFLLAMIFSAAPGYSQMPGAAIVRRKIPEPPADLISNPVAQKPGQPPQQLPDAVLAWDAVSKEIVVSNGTPQTHFTFALTNISSETVTIDHVRASCDCTTASLVGASVLKPGAWAHIEVTMNVKGKSGTVAKTLYVDTNRGIKELQVKTQLQMADADPDRP